MKILASIFLTISFGLATAQSFTAYTVANIHKVSSDTYSVTADTVKTKQVLPSAIPANGTKLTVVTQGCAHVPNKNGEKGMIVVAQHGRALLFESGARCTIVNLQ